MQMVSVWLYEDIALYKENWKFKFCVLKATLMTNDREEKAERRKFQDREGNCNNDNRKWNLGKAKDCSANILIQHISCFVY
jgi:hypothetical protein